MERRKHADGTDEPDDTQPALPMGRTPDTREGTVDWAPVRIAVTVASPTAMTSIVGANLLIDDDTRLSPSRREFTSVEEVAEVYPEVGSATTKEPSSA